MDRELADAPFSLRDDQPEGALLLEDALAARPYAQLLGAEELAATEIAIDHLLVHRQTYRACLRDY